MGFKGISQNSIMKRVYIEKVKYLKIEAQCTTKLRDERNEENEETK